jgi:hypothetical protein
MRGSGCGALPGRSEASEACVRARSRRRTAELACQGCAGAARGEIVVRGQPLPQPPAAPSPSSSMGREQAVVGPGLALQRLRSFSLQRRLGDAGDAVASSRRRRRCSCHTAAPSAKCSGCRQDWPERAARPRGAAAQRRSLRTALPPRRGHLSPLSGAFPTAASRPPMRCIEKREREVPLCCCPPARVPSTLPLPAAAAARAISPPRRRCGSAAGSAGCSRARVWRAAGTERHLAAAASHLLSSALARLRTRYGGGDSPARGTCRCILSGARDSLGQQAEVTPGRAMR